MLGLLLIVTMIATYLQTQLPAQMRVNDESHALQVENQVERLATTLRAVAAVATIGAVLSEPISLGSSGAPPIVAGDGSAIGPGAQGSQIADSFTVLYGSVSTPQTSSGAMGASFVVNLKNSYEPYQVVAFDQGAVVYAQPNGFSQMVLPPAVSYSGGALTLWIPEFLGSIGTETGLGTAELSARLVSLLNLSLPSDGYTLTGATSIAVTTPYAAAWYSFFNVSSFAGHVVCIPHTSSACAGPFVLNGPLGTVYANVTATALWIQVATFALTLT